MSKRRIAWLVPYPLKGSGGQRTIFQNIITLAEAGHECHVYLEPPGAQAQPSYATAGEGRTLVESYFDSVPATFHIGFEPREPMDLIFATAWFTAIPLRRFQTKAIKAYFVQDDEAAFQPIGDHYFAAENTLRYGFQTVTIGRWLAMRLKRDFGASAGFFDFCADRSVYHPMEGARRDRAVCFLYQPDKPRRCSQLGLQALTIVKRLLPDVKIELYGDDAREVGFENRGLLSIAECNLLYNRCQVGLCFSTTNPSRIPFEMMAAGLPVVDVFGENTRYDLPSTAVSLAETTPESIAQALITLLNDEPRLTRMSEAGRAFMKSRDLSVGLAQFSSFVDGLFAGAAISPDLPEPLYQAPPVRASPAEVERYRVELELAEADHRRSGTVRSPGGLPRDAPASASATRRILNRLRHTLRVLATGN